MNNFDERRKTIIVQCDGLLEGKRNIVSTIDKIKDSNLQGDKLKYALIFVEVNEIQYCREMEKICNSWLELILEINEYIKNKELQHTSAIKYLYDSLKEFISMVELLHQDLPDECEEIIVRMDQIFGRCITKISESTEWIKQG